MRTLVDYGHRVGRWRCRAVSDSCECVTASIWRDGVCLGREGKWEVGSGMTVWVTIRLAVQASLHVQHLVASRCSMGRLGERRAVWRCSRGCLDGTASHSSARESSRRARAAVAQSGSGHWPESGVSASGRVFTAGRRITALGTGPFRSRAGPLVDPAYRLQRYGACRTRHGDGQSTPRP